MDASNLFARNFLDVKYEDLPVKTVAETKKQVLDYIGVAMGGYGQDGAKEVRELAIEWGGAPQSTILSCGVKVPAANAAQANATMVHSLDFDDVHEAAIMHPGVVTISTSLAIGEYMGGLSGKDFIQAVAVGGDMISRMGLATRPGDNVHKYGWHLTTLNGFMTSAAVAGKIMGLGEDKLINAIGIGYHQSSGNGQAVKDGVLTKRLGPGFAVRGGIQAAMLASKGVTGARNAMEGVQGFYYVYHGNCYSRDILVGDLGKRFESENTSIKPYPCCRGTHPTIDATLALVSENDIPPGDVEGIKIWAGRGTLDLLALPLEVKAKPRNYVDSQFSLVWGCATAIVKKRVTLSSYTETAIKDKAVLDVAAKVQVEYDPKFDTGGLEPMYIEITMKNGKVYKKLMETATGSPEKPATFEEVVSKFHGCIEFSARPMPKENAEKVIEMVGGLEKVGDIRELIKLLVW
jgi:2-methylcitrate dehydratase PrpD